MRKEMKNSFLKNALEAIQGIFLVKQARKKGTQEFYETKG